MAKSCMYPWLFCIFLISLILNSIGLSEQLVNDFGWHASISNEMYSIFPEIPQEIPLIRQGVAFVYPPFSHFIAAAAKQLLPDVRLVVIMRYITVFFASVSVFPIYLMGVQVFKRQEIGLCSALIFALSPIYVAYYQYAQTVALPFVLLSVFFVMYGMDKRSRTISLFGGIFLGIGYWAHLAPPLFISVILGAISVFYLIRREYWLARPPLYAILVSLGFLMLYLLKFGLLSDIHSLVAPSRLLPFFMPERFVGIWRLGYERILLLAFGIAGAILSVRSRFNNPLMLLFLLASCVLSFAGAVGLYLLLVPLSYVRYLIVPLSVFGGFALYQVLTKWPGRRQLFLAIFFAYFFYIAMANSERYVGLSAQDRTAFSWLRENLEPGAVVASDNGHSFWLPVMANVSTINGRKLDEFSSDMRDFDVATIFAATDAKVKLAVLNKYGARYVFYSDDSVTGSRRYPRLTMEDRWGEYPAWGVWASSSAGIYLFEERPFRRLYSDYRPIGRDYGASAVVYEA